ncbi:LLM class flavin-dependent oxidoreductase [Nocardia sp. NPDC058658]|uniref:LLM class flavin-dependent oxidoreductase n=1 Tax=Nocardia sp. NPDC058658 TaxID=3346580 RepID=UPI003656292B
MFSADPKSWISTARWAEDAGISALLLSDLPAPVSAPLTALSYAATTTTTLEDRNMVAGQRLPQSVRSRAEAATLDLVSDGRLQLRLGAGQAAIGYGELGIAGGSDRVRFERWPATSPPSTGTRTAGSSSGSVPTTTARSSTRPGSRFPLRASGFRS